MFWLFSKFVAANFTREPSMLDFLVLMVLAVPLYVRYRVRRVFSPKNRKYRSYGDWYGDQK